jgi:hypothetical protein
MDITVIDAPSDVPSDYLDKLTGYDANSGVDSLLDITRDIWDSEAYYFLGAPFPTGPDIFFNKPGSGFVNQTFAGDIQIPPFSILTKITYFSQQPETDGGQVATGNRPFKIRIYDHGAKNDMIHKQFTLVPNVASAMRGARSGVILPRNDEFGPYYLTSLLTIMPPGSLHVEITDLSGAVNNIIQVLFAFAVPRTSIMGGAVTAD